MDANKDFMKCITLMWTIITLLTFIVSCSNTPILSTEHELTILTTRQQDNGVLVAVSINYQDNVWLEDIILKVAEYAAYEDQKTLPVQARFYNRGKVCQIRLFLNGRQIKKLFLSKEMADQIESNINVETAVEEQTYSASEDPTK